MSNLPRFNVGTLGHVDIASKARAFESLVLQEQFPPIFNPSHWPPRPTRLSIAIRLGITRMLLERRA